MSGANESIQDKAIHDYLESLLLEVSDEIEESPINPDPVAPTPIQAVPKVNVETADEQVLPHEEPEVKPPVIGLENLVAEVETIAKTEVTTETVVEEVTEVIEQAAEEPVESEIPAWAEERFQCLLFNVSGLSLAVPLVKLNSVITWDDDAITKTPNQTSWYLGLIQHLQKQIKVIDTALLVMPENRLKSIDTASLNRLNNILLVDDYKWGLACDSIGDVIWLTKDDVKWRKNKETRAWLSGTSLEHLCAIMDTEVFAKMLNETS